MLSKVQIVDFLRRKTTYSLETIRGPVGGQVKSVFVVSSSWQCGYWFNYLKVMPVFICLSGSLFFPNTISTLRSDPHISLFLPPQLSSWFSVHPCLHALGPPPPCWHLTFITAWPWLSLLSSLLWCSITLSSWGKHWCQATVMTFWLSVFMWWMRWKCTTTAKRGWRRAKLPHRARGSRGQGRGKQQNK